MNKLKEIDGTMYQSANVVMLSTKKASTFIKCIKDTSVRKVGELLNEIVIDLNRDYFQYQQIYITSDEEIKDGDWIVKANEGRLIQYLKMPIDGNTEWRDYGYRKIIATTDPSLGLPLVSKQFVQKYVEEHNKGSIITAVLVEMKELSDDDMFFFNRDVEKENDWYSLKTDLHNCITIKKIKDSWSREEVIKYTKEVLDEFCDIIDANWNQETLQKIINKIL